MSIRKLNTKTKLPASCCDGPRTKKFESKTKREGTAKGIGRQTMFLLMNFESILLGQLTIKIN